MGNSEHGADYNRWKEETKKKCAGGFAPLSSAPKASSLSVCLAAPSACPRLPAHVCLPTAVCPVCLPVCRCLFYTQIVHSPNRPFFFFCLFLLTAAKSFSCPLYIIHPTATRKHQSASKNNKDHHSITQHTQPCPIQNAEMTTTCRCPRVYHLSRTIITTPYSFLVWMTD